MIYQSKYGQVFDIPIDLYLNMTDEELDDLCESYGTSDKSIILLNGSSSEKNLDEFEEE